MKRESEEEMERYWKACRDGTAKPVDIQKGGASKLARSFLNKFEEVYGKEVRRKTPT